MHRRSILIRCLALPAAFIIIFILVLVCTQSKAEFFRENDSIITKPVITKDSLHKVTLKLIQDKGLTINWDLQSFIADTAQKYKIGFTTIVVMDAHTGDILAMYGKNYIGEDSSLCLETHLAASVFKIITATAALDYGGMSCDSVFNYNGRPHTLYKNQLTENTNKWTKQVTLAKAFAASNNVVFAKIGSSYLGEPPVLLAAMKLGFWRSPLEECECSPSTLYIPDNQFSAAELACGFNRQTRISPVHAAQLITAVINDGRMITPRLVHNINTEPVQAMSVDAAKELKSMMAETIASGTVSKSFRRYQNDRVLKNLYLGAKSGSINGEDPEGRRNWFVGYAEHMNSGEAITIGCLIIRDVYFRIEADKLSKQIIKYYFSKPAHVAKSS